MRDFANAYELDKSIPPLVNLGRAWALNANRLDEAIKQYDQALAADPKLIAALQSRGEARLEKREPDAAIADFEQVLGLAPKAVPAVLGLAQAWLDKGVLTSEINILDAAAAIDRRNPECWDFHRRNVSKLKDNKSALLSKKKIIQFTNLYNITNE